MVVVDARGERWPAASAPRRPTVVIATSPGTTLAGDPEPVLLLRGDAGDDVVEDLGRAPVRASTIERSVAARIEREPGRVTIVPDAPLDRGARYVVAIAAWARDADGATLGEPWLGPLVVAPVGSGATVVASWPAAGTPAVPTELPLAAIRFDEVVSGIEDGVWIEAPGERVASAVAPIACEEIGWEGGSCVAIRPERALAPATPHRIVASASVLDATGAPVGPWSAHFDTSYVDDRRALEWIALPCAIDEREIAIGCALEDDARAVLRVAASGPARIWVESDAGVARAVAPRGDATLALAGIAADTEFVATVRSIDLGGRTREEAVVLATTTPLARVAITEARIDPFGPEPAQEYVEVSNFGPVAIDLRGFAISDRADAVGDVIAEAGLLAPGARALIVASAFDPEHPDDEPAQPGTPLVRVGTSIGSGGLSSAGEPLFLRGPDGRRVSSMPAMRSEEGRCIVRVTDDPRTDALADFRVDPVGCTPGAPDRTAPPP